MDYDKEKIPVFSLYSLLCYWFLAEQCCRYGAGSQISDGP